MTEPTGYVDGGNTKQIIVQLKDGTTWTADIDLDGRVHLVSQLSDPEQPTASVGDGSEPGDWGEEKEEAAEEAPKPMFGPSSPSEPSEPGEEEKSKGPIADSIADFIEKMKHRQLKSSENRDKNPYGKKPSIPPTLLKELRDNAFRARLSSIMLDNKYDRRVRGRTRGKLDMGRLFKVPTGSRSVFTKKESRRGKEYNVVLLVDESGSMSGNKSKKAADAAVFLVQAFEGININVAVVGFNAIINVRKDWTSKPDYAAIHEGIHTMNWHQGSGDNNDWDGLNRAYKMFETAPKGENILIMLSDGNPVSTSRPTFYDVKGNAEKAPRGTESLKRSEKDQKVHLHHLVKSHKDVHSIGIGIMEGGWQIPDHEVIQNVDDLKKVIIKKISKAVSRG